MRKESWSVLFAFGLGALIGSFAALDIASRFELGRYFAVLGALLGGLVAYVAVDFRQLLAGICRAWMEAATWEPDLRRWKAFFLGFSAAFVFLVTVLSPIGLLIFTADSYRAGLFFEGGVVVLSLFAALCFGRVVASKRCESMTE